MDQKSFYFPDDAGAPFHVALVGQDWSVGTGDYDYRRSRPAFTAFEFLEEGMLNAEVNGARFRPQAGDLYLLRQGSRFAVSDTPGVQWRKTWFVVTGAMAEDLVAAYDLAGFHHVPACPVGPLLRRMFRVASAPPTDRAAVALRLATMAFEVILRAGVACRCAARVPSAEVAGGVEFLNANLRGRVTIAALGRVLGCSAGHACRLFRRELGITPHAYLLRRRIQMAELLLTHSHLNIKEIAYRLGFCDQFHFSNTFRRKTGQSPLAFRRDGSE